MLLDGANRAVGVEYLSGERLYRAHRQPSGAAGRAPEMRASREVILAGGAFNTPQLLMLSGIGPREGLERHGIEVRVELPGVGRNLQDRYEIGVVTGWPSSTGRSSTGPGSRGAILSTGSGRTGGEESTRATARCSG